MASLLAAAIFFVGIHFFISGSPVRGKIVALIGKGPFRGVFSLLSLIGIIWLSRAYGQAEYTQLWGEPYVIRPLALITMLLAFFFVVLAFASPNPTAVGDEALASRGGTSQGYPADYAPSFFMGRRSVVLYSSNFERRSRLCAFLWQFFDPGGSRTFFDRSKTPESFWRCLESIRCFNLERALYGDHRGPQLAKDR
jgi:hypothetical protein